MNKNKTIKRLEKEIKALERIKNEGVIKLYNSVNLVPQETREDFFREINGQMAGIETAINIIKSNENKIKSEV